MSAKSHQVVSIFDELYDYEQSIVLAFLKSISELHKKELDRRNSEYMKKIERSKNQIAEGKIVKFTVEEFESRFPYYFL